MGLQTAGRTSCVAREVPSFLSLSFSRSFARSLPPLSGPDGVTSSGLSVALAYARTRGGRHHAWNSTSTQHRWVWRRVLNCYREHCEKCAFLFLPLLRFSHPLLPSGGKAMEAEPPRDTNSRLVSLTKFKSEKSMEWGNIYR